MNLPYKETVVLIPTYNEILNIERMIETLMSLYPGLSILIIDDNSPDKTGDKVRMLQEKYSTLFLLSRTKKEGLGRAYIAGFKWALENKFNYILEMDCDFSHDPKDVGRLIEVALTHDLAIGSRYIDGVRTKDWPWYRLILSYYSSLLTRIITGMNLRDITGGFKCFRRSALEKINLDNIISVGYVFQCEMNYKIVCAELSVKEIPITFHQRTHGDSKMSYGIIFEALIVIIQLRLKNLLGRLN